MDGYEREMVYRAGRNPVLDAAQDRADAIADAWANAPQKAFEDDYTAFVGWAESTLAPILVAALVAERAETARLRNLFDDISDPHHERMSGVGKGNCVECRYPWPCPTEQIASTARAAAAAVVERGES